MTTMRSPAARASRRPLARPARLLTALLLAALGCFRMGKLPARELYRLAPPDSLVPRLALVATPRDSLARTGGGGGEVARPVLPGTLGVMTYVTPGLYGDRAIVYRIGETEYGAYPSREWALPLGEMLGHLTARIAAGTALVREAPVYDPPSPRARTYLWRATVREFEEVDRGRAVLASVRIDATLVRAADDSIVWAGTAARERPVAGSTMTAVVGALSLLAAETIAELLGDAERALARPAAAAARRTP